MNTFLTRTAVAVSSVVLISSCGTGSAQDLAPSAASADRLAVSPGATYDGWIVRSRRDATPPPCPWSPGQVQRMQESGQPLPGCIVRLQRWFQQEYDPSWLPAGGADH